MNTTQWLHTRYLPVPLIALMVLTRFHHFGDALHLPDASLAVFFFAGFYRKTIFFVFLLALAGLIDTLAIANGTSSWCVSPAYLFLIPTYAVMWFAGRHCSRFKSLTGTELLLSIVWLALAATAAFVISNGSFYLFSGRYSEMALNSYIAATAGYFLPYAGTALAYGLVIYAGVKFVKLMAVAKTEQKQV